MEKLLTEITENGIHYTLHGDYYFPDIIGPQDDPRPIGKWGRIHMRYLQEHRPILYNQLVLQGKLSTYLADLNEQAQKRLEVIIQQMKRDEGVTEQLKAMNQIQWVRRMNSIRQRAKELVLNEMVMI